MSKSINKNNIKPSSDAERLKHNEYNKKWREVHRDPNQPRAIRKTKEEQRQGKTDYQRNWRKNNNERFRKKESERKGYKVGRYREKRKATLTYLGGKCCICHENDYDILQIDHIHGGGGKERKERTGGNTKFYNSILAGNRSDLRLLCSYCNIRAFEYGSSHLEWPEELLKQIEKAKEHHFKRNLI